MGVYAHNFHGYSMDVTEEYRKVKEDYYHIFDLDEPDKEKTYNNLIKIGVKPYWMNNGSFVKGDITLLYDGMSGKYAKLIYIINEENYANNEYEEEFVLKDKINDMSAKLKLREVYKNLFNESDEEKEIELIRFSHYH